MTQPQLPSYHQKTVLLIGDSTVTLNYLLQPLVVANALNIVLVENTFPTQSQWCSADVVIAEEPLRQDLGYWLLLKAIPVLVLCHSSRSSVRVTYLEAGAMDCLSIPFNKEELLARTRVLLRSHSSNFIELREGGLLLNLLTREVFLDKKLVPVTMREFYLLHYLLTHPNRVCHRQELLRQVWGKRCCITTRTVDTHINQLRQKLNLQQIHGVHGVGYRYQPDLG
ncbi:DNA-binding response regulator [Vibrio parahaemolyticus]|uniref:winged helix-turn-helix domain-containing protein n=1 Tax=Vibrio TaxID=662 RepID=UPI00069416E8|nr:MULTISPECIES: winged helix-turn-helix domain-containing protein [Vibrio]TOK04627.1 DNA-binding response regulator [Vibrio parahaemolyticus]TOM58930.1 DNA-binding response regulator [Vibrio parahaemolyticus]TOM64768.1 DNA-binding response regulator [Vibrio parahaemolyticus]TOM73418.1 DNA-binding response regulator [Vibrio parahaemolyticus]TOO81903.1 DNA-binding response regulator [Vibrio parahaemolyticus]